jgi:hypothetical protein
MAFGRLWVKVLSLAVVASAWGLAADAVAADQPIWIARIVRDVPATPEAMAQAHQKSQWGALEVAIGDPLEIPDFEGKTTYTLTIKENGKAVRKQLDFDYSRLGVVTYGMKLLPEDEAELPLVSKRRILSRVDGNYISVQLRVQRDSDNNIYLHYKPFAAVGHYEQDGTHEFAKLMEDSVRDFRSLGLYVKAGTKISADALRTFVAINKSELAEGKKEDGSPLLKDHYELLFVRARVDGDKVTLHTFTTNDYGQVLHYMRPYSVPADPDACDVTSTIFFTEYTLAKQSPSSKGDLQVDFHSRESFPISQLDAFATEQGWEGTALENLTATLDAIIDGKVKEAP